MVRFYEDGSIYVCNEPDYMPCVEDCLYVSKWLCEREPEATLEEWLGNV